MLPTVLVILTVAALYWFPVRRWMNHWGDATPADLTRVMAGDSLLPDPTYSGTVAITINATPEHIWPWLVQIGYQRGLYSYDWLDRLFGYLDRPSASRILPEFQHLAVGDVIPLGRGPNWPVAVLEPNRALVLDMRNQGGLDWVWQFGLYPVDETRTQLVSRSCVRTQKVWGRLLTHAIEPAGFVMTRRMLLGLKQRAEALRAASTGETRVNRRPAA